MSTSEENYLIPHFLALPTKEKLREQYEVFRGVNGGGKWKVGVTINPKTRYNKTSLYHQLTEDSYFATASSFSIATSVETIMTEVLKEFGDHHDTGHGTTGKAASHFFIYLVAAKTDDDMCPICEKVWLTKREDRQAHLELKHDTWVEDYQALKDHFMKVGDAESVEECNELLDWPILGV